MGSPARAQTLPPPRSDRRGPEIYLHLEFRVSWGGKKQQSPKSHQLTFRSRGSKERSPAFPRQVPAPNTNYLADIHDFEQRQSRLREMRQNANPNRHHQMQEYYYQGNQSGNHLQVPIPIIREPERPTRADARPSSHERGRSAPPPLGENPWDVSVVPSLPARNSDIPPANRRMAEIRRKPLPAPPSQFRLGEGGQPWSAWSLPDGYDPDTAPKNDEDARGYEDLPAVAPPADRNSTTFATNPTMVSTFSPGPATLPDPDSSSPERLRDVETGRARELGALSAAMMTVDNGFESQWWYQGRRDTVMGTDEVRVAAHHRWSTGPISATASPFDTPQLPAGVVSPMTDAAFSPAQVPASLLQRTLSTRSEELWFREKTQ